MFFCSGRPQMSWVLFESSWLRMISLVKVAFLGSQAFPRGGIMPILSTVAGCVVECGSMQMLDSHKDTCDSLSTKMPLYIFCQPAVDIVSFFF